jgi:glycosyltransferase involved in cell wall biosynthesis
MDVDLVVPYYNGHDYIEAAILSAVKQTAPFGKIFLVDDGSESDSSEFAKDIALQ